MKGFWGDYFLKPFWKLEARLGEGLKDFYKSYLNLRGVKEENQKLREKLWQLEQELAFFREREVLYQK
ncbi:MAG: hypothetical protein P3W84_001725 [Thermodesulfobacteriaceae bacterium]|nr:hypothetical protein [Thermodesulfobacteriaceae bacterium]